MKENLNINVRNSINICSRYNNYGRRGVDPERRREWNIYPDVYIDSRGTFNG
jgi:hypothetical protein